ncbi:MAG: sigma-70 family RNA polymerase sigma factor [Planctomycetota bacterium]
MVSPRDSDQRLIELLRDGDDDAAAVIYDRYAPKLNDFVAAKLDSRLKSSTDPEDLVQSILWSLVRRVRMGQYEAPEGKTLWSLITVMALHRVQRRREHFSAQKRDGNRNISLADLVADQSGREVVPASASLEEFHRTVQDVVESVGPELGQILQLRLEGFLVEEIADKLKRSKRSVERVLSRLKQQLAKTLIDLD